MLCQRCDQAAAKCNGANGAEIRITGGNQHFAGHQCKRRAYRIGDGDNAAALFMEKRKGIKSGFGVARIANGDQAVLLLCIAKIGNVYHIGRALQQLHIAVHTRKHKAQHIRNGIRRAVSDHIDLFGLAQQVGRTVDRLQGLRLAQRFQQAHVFGHRGNHAVFGGLGLLFAVNVAQHGFQGLKGNLAGLCAGKQNVLKLRVSFYSQSLCKACDGGRADAGFFGKLVDG